MDVEFDPTRPSPARMYNYYLRGKDWFEADARAAEDVLRIAPEIAVLARANHGFLTRAVRRLAEQGIDQFLDIGTGIPTSPTVHEVAREILPDAHVVYLDNDPMVTAHNHALRDTPDGVTSVEADLRDPVGLLTHPEVRFCIDFTRPVAVLLVAVAHFIADAEDPAGLIRALRAGVVPGSYLVLSHATATPRAVARARQAADVYGQTHATTTAHVRTKEEIHRLAAAWGPVVPPDLEPVGTWPEHAPVTGVTLLAGLATAEEAITGAG